MHKSLRELIDNIKVSESCTIDFKAYGLLQVAIYSAIAQSIITPMVIINSVILALLVTKWILHRKHEFLSRALSLNSRFKGVRDNFRSRRNSFDKSFDDNKRNTLRRSFRGNRRSFRNKIRNSPHMRRCLPNSLGTSSHMDVGTNTEIKPPVLNIINPKVVSVYPVLPKYIKETNH